MCLRGLTPPAIPLLSTSLTMILMMILDNWSHDIQARGGLAVLLSALELLEKQKYHYIFQLILATKACNPSSDFYKADDAFLRRQHLSILA